MLHAYAFLVGVCLPALVFASIYPTQPIQATVWSADQPMLVSWVEDWTYPVLSEMGHVTITLWRDTEEYLVQLASDVDPTAKSCQVTVPVRVLKQGSKFTLRFTTTKPIDAVVYSADFVIMAANTSTTTGSITGTGSGGVALATQVGTGTGTGSGAGTETGSGSGFKTVPTTTGSSFSWTTTTTTSVMAVSSDRSAVPSGVPPPSGTIPGGGVPGQGQGQRAASAGRRGVDVEKLKFRFVFVIWPVLMGITMAL